MRTALLGMLASVGVLLMQAANVSAQSGVNLNRYCAKRGLGQAINVDGTGYGWRCSVDRTQISVADACHEQYGSSWTAQLITAAPGGPNDWRCVSTSGSAPPTASTLSASEVQMWRETINAIAEMTKDTGVPPAIQSLQQKLASGTPVSDANLATALRALVAQLKSDPATAPAASMIEESLADLEKSARESSSPASGSTGGAEAGQTTQSVPPPNAGGPNHAPTIDGALLAPMVVPISSTFKLSFWTTDVDGDLMHWLVDCPNARPIHSSSGFLTGGEGQLASYAKDPRYTVPSGTLVQMEFQPWIGFRDILKVGERSAQHCSIDVADSRGASVQRRFDWYASRDRD